MKKFVVFALISAMCVSMAACSNSDSTSSDSSSAGTSESSTAGETSSDAAGETSGEAKVGFSITPTLSAESEEATFSTVYAAVMVDADGKILACDIDESEFAPALTDGAVGEVDLRTKMEKGDDYGMVAAGASTMEWYQQAEAFEQYVTGKTGDEVSAIELSEGKATDADLSAGCTITISSILSNTEKAIAAAK